MTITIKEMRNSGDASQDFSDATRITEHYIIEDDTNTDLTFALIKAAGVLIPFGTVYPGTNARCSSYDLTPELQNRSVWRYKVDYETRNSGSGGDSDGNPIKEPAKVWFGLKMEQRPVDRAYDEGQDYDDPIPEPIAIPPLPDNTRGNPFYSITDSASQPYDPAVLEEFGYLVVYIEKNYRDFNVDDLGIFSGTLNQGPITIGGVKFKSEQGWMMVMRHRLLFDSDNEPYDRIHYEIVKNPDRWRRRITSSGYWMTDFSQGIENIVNRPILVRDVVKDPSKVKNPDAEVSTPQLLDANGEPTAKSGLEPDVSEYLTKWKLSWSKLNLPVRKDGRR